MFTLPYDSVLVPMDFSEESLGAVATARAAMSEGGVVHVLHVVEMAHLADPYSVWVDVDDESRQTAAREELTRVLQERGITGVQAQTRLGVPARAIVDYATEVGAQLVVLPTHGRTGASRWLIGSVAEKVVRLAPCPVLVLRKA